MQKKEFQQNGQHNDRTWKRLFRRGLALVLTAVLALSVMGCGGDQNRGMNGDSSGGTDADNDTNVAAKGRYLENPLTTPEYFQGNGELIRLSDGSISIVDFGNGIRNISADRGQTWSSEPLEEIQDLFSYFSQSGGAAAPDGGILVYYVDWENPVEGQLYPERYVYFAADGSKQTFEPGLDGYNSCTEAAVFSPGGRLFVVTNGLEVYEIDLQNSSAEELFSIETIYDLSLYADDTRLLVQDGEKMYCYNYDDGTVTSEDTVLNSFIEEQTDKKPGIAMCLGEDPDTSLFLASIDGIYHHVQGGSVMEQLADGNLTNLGDPARKPVNILQMEEESFLILYDNGELYSYVYDPEAPTVPEEQITIYSLYDNETVRRAINVFRKENPDVFVKFELGLSGDDGMTETDAIHNLNTRLLAGESPDLLLLGGMPIDSYIEKGILVDLSDEVTELKSESSFFEGILEGYRQEDGIYVVPFRYEIPLISGNKAEISSITDLSTLADAAWEAAASGQVKETVMGTYTAEELLEKLYVLCADAWISKTGEVDRTALQEFLADAKRIYEAEQENLSDAARKQHEESVIGIWNFYSEEEAKKTLEGIQNQVFAQLMGQQLWAAGYLYDVNDYQYVLSLNKTLGELGSFGYQLWNGQSSNVFLPTGMIGLSANAKNPECAKRFLKTLFLEDVQKENLEDGFPVNRDAFWQFSQNPYPAGANQGFSISMGNEEGEFYNLSVHWPDSSELEELSALISTLNTPAGTDSLLKDNIISIGSKALTGEKDIDESVEEIVQKISLYLQE